MRSKRCSGWSICHIGYCQLLDLVYGRVIVVVSDAAEDEVHTVWDEIVYHGRLSIPFSGLCWAASTMQRLAKPFMENIKQRHILSSFFSISILNHNSYRARQKHKDKGSNRELRLRVTPGHVRPPVTNYRDNIGGYTNLRRFEGMEWLDYGRANYIMKTKLPRT